MSRSTDPGHFFQSDASEAIRARRAAKSGNTFGDPIKLQSKILAVVTDPASSASIYVAESAGCIRRVNLDSRDTKTVYRGPTSPLTSLAIGGQNGQTLFAGCWDKDIWAWDVATCAPKQRLKGHSDFVKAVVSAKLGGKNVLISGGADKKIMVWDTETGQRLHTLRDKLDNMLAVQCLAIDPVASTTDELVVLSSSSDPKIRRWRLTLESAEQILEKTDEKDGKEAIHEHETSVYSMWFDVHDEEGDLYTASADGTAKCLSRAKKWAAEDTYEHGDYVRAVIATEDWIITTGRNEDVKIWDRSSAKLKFTYEGHFEEVTGLVVLDDGKKVVSVSIDGTVRTWSLTKRDLLAAQKEKEERDKGLVKEVSVEEKKPLMTAEEEAELAELMDESD